MATGLVSCAAWRMRLLFGLLGVVEGRVGLHEAFEAGGSHLVRTFVPLVALWWPAGTCPTRPFAAPDTSEGPQGDFLRGPRLPGAVFFDIDGVASQHSGASQVGGQGLKHVERMAKGC